MESHLKISFNHILLSIEEEVEHLIPEEDEEEVNPSQDRNQQYKNRLNNHQITLKEEEEDAITTICKEELIR